MKFQQRFSSSKHAQIQLLEYPLCLAGHCNHFRGLLTTYVENTLQW
jgi:hypothetical protein